jgi:transposase
LKQEGWPQKNIATALGVSQGAVSQWLKRAREHGEVEGLKRRAPPGMTPRLSAEQRTRLPLLLAKGAESYGYRGDVWTARRVAQLIADTFGVRYHRDHVSRLLRQLGWSRQRPVKRATQRDAEAIAHWREERWPALRTKPSRKGPLSSG